MKIKLLETISSECGRFLQTKGSELQVTDTDEQRGVYEATLNDGFFVVPFQCAEAIIEPLVINKTAPSKYHRLNTIENKEFIDFYDIINLLQSNGEQIPPEIQHALKKLMYNDRGHKNMVQDKLAELDDRIKRIESSIDKMHHAIIGKVGEFGESSAMIHKDLENLHGTVSKLMNPLVDNYNELKKLNKKK